MTGTIIIYKLTALNPIERDNLCRELLGRIVKTHHGKYTYRIKGVLDDVPHIRIGRGILITEKVNKQKLFRFFKKYKIKNIFIRDIILTKTDIRRLKK